MERHLILGTAGHIDHGKTTLVKALTGVDTDRLPDEKARGITIDLGFAPLDLGGGLHAGVVDVPGHENFVRNMVAGATGMDMALLVVAADEGVMPQTREHVAILRLLGVQRGVVALSRSDLAADEDWKMLVAEDVRALLTAEFGHDWPVVAVSAVTGEGLGSLRQALATEAARAPQRSREDLFRMPVDRVFTMAGAGTVVTGTVWSGSLTESARVTILPAGIEARIRSIQVHGAVAGEALPGMRVALALVGPSRQDLTRGDTVVGGEGWRTSMEFDAEVALVAGAALKPRMRLRVHHGTAEVLGRVSALGGATPQGRAARISLESPLALRAADRFVLRAWSPVTTIGGGVVSEPWSDHLRAPRRRSLRSEPALFVQEPVARVAALVRRRGQAGLTLEALRVCAGLAAGPLAESTERLSAGRIVERQGWFVADEEVAAAAERMTEALTRWHSGNRLEAGMPVRAWMASAGEVEAVAELAAARLYHSGVVAREGAVVRAEGFRPGVSAEAIAAQTRVLDALRIAGAEPPSVPELAAMIKGVDVPGVLRLLARTGAVVAVSPDRYYEAEALRQERSRLVQVLAELGRATPADIRERVGRSRKWLIPLLEWADREGVTVRDGDQRRLHVQPDA